VSSTVLSSGARPGGTVLVMRDIRERKSAEAQLHQMAHYDAVTGLPNRNLLITMMRQTLARLPWHRTHAAVLFADVDRFKFVNDSLGHHAGDELLRALGERLRRLVRPGDLVARLGGDEFVILLHELAQPGDAARVSEKILRGVAEPMQVGGQAFDITLSMGICVAPADGDEPHELLRKADLAMYTAKREGKNRFCFYSAAMGERSAQHLALEADLRHALDASEGLIVHYQPQESTGGTLTGLEALLRWDHPRLGMLSPARFLPIAEDADLMGRVDAWVLHAACAQLTAWRAGGLAVPRVSVNVSNQMFRRQDLVELVRRTLAETGLPASALELELTEAIVMDDFEAALQTMTALRALGVALSIDDFGTGYSSLAHLKRCPIQTLKIDRAFVGDIASDPGDAAIVQAIIAMARKLGISTLAEGVETPEQRRLLHDFGIDMLQGFLISQPLPASEIPAFLAGHGRTTPFSRPAALPLTREPRPPRRAS
jgi:diguanylate cyclase (GGDEF)-like protein